MANVNEFNAETGEAVLRDFTPEELSQYIVDSTREPVYDIVPTDNQVLVSALEKLQELGLTESQAKAIAGIA